MCGAVSAHTSGRVCSGGAVLACCGSMWLSTTNKNGDSFSDLIGWHALRYMSVLGLCCQLGQALCAAVTAQQSTSEVHVIAQKYSSACAVS